MSVYCARQNPAHPFLGAPSVQSCCNLSISAPNLYLSVADIANPDLFACSNWTWISLDIAHFYEEHCQPSSGSAWPACPKGNRAHIVGGGRGRHNLHRVCQTALTASPCVGCDTDIQHCIHHIANIPHSVLTRDVKAHALDSLALVH